MTWSRYFLNDYFTAREFDEVDKRIRTQARARAAGNREMRERIEELEEENARLALLLRALTELSVRKGLFSQQELQAVTREVDLWDGSEDGRYGPPPKRDAIDVAPPPSTREFLGDLEQRDDL
ncbi:MAG: hypothetical protein KDB14_32660 [Planctomycetales bacterium]|nr:hypothetical protein [Planctomycetales bacterium]